LAIVLHAPARWGWRESSHSGWDRAAGRAGRATSSNSKIQTLPPRDGRRRRAGVGNDHRWAGLKRPVAQTLRVPLAAFGQVDDGVGDRLTGRIELSPVAPGLDGGFESKAHETRGFSVESLTFEVGPYRHSG